MSGREFDTPRIGALVVAYNRREDTLDCVRSLIRDSLEERSVYVVDNASTDGSPEALAESFPKVNLIRSEENLGFAGGNNIGLAQMIEDGLDAAFLINNDAVVEPGTLRRLAEAAFSEPETGVTTPKILLHSDPGVIWAAGGNIDPENGVAVQRCYGEDDQGQADKPADLDYAIWCAMLIKTSAILKVGGMDPSYFMYYEEAEWCRRIREAGFRIVYVPGARVLHKVGLVENGRNDMPYYMSRNRLIYLRSGGMNASGVAWIAVSEILRSAAGHAAHGRTREGRLMVRAVFDYFAGNDGRMGQQT